MMTFGDSFIDSCKTFKNLFEVTLLEISREMSKELLMKIISMVLSEWTMSKNLAKLSLKPVS